MKKFVKVVSIVAALSLAVAMMTGCKANVTSTSSSENSVTRNGITRTETTVTTNGNTTTTVTYKDANGNELSADVGEAAFNKAAAQSMSASADRESTETAAASEKVTAVFHFANQSGRAISGLYIVPDGTTELNLNLLERGGALADETMRTWEEFYYTPGCTWRMVVHFADAADTDLVVFDDNNFDTATDPHNLEFTITAKENGDGYSMTRA